MLRVPPTLLHTTSIVPLSSSHRHHRLRLHHGSFGHDFACRTNSSHRGSDVCIPEFLRWRSLPDPRDFHRGQSAKHEHVMRMMMKPNNTRTRNRQGSRGVALITALLLLSLFTVMTLAMVIATSSDLLIDGYYRNLRGSFYAADSGLNAARQFMMNQLAGDVTPNYVQS